jgi:hypothetical protein
MGGRRPAKAACGGRCHCVRGGQQQVPEPVGREAGRRGGRDKDQRSIGQLQGVPPAITEGRTGEPATRAAAAVRMQQEEGRRAPSRVQVDKFAGGRRTYIHRGPWTAAAVYITAGHGGLTTGVAIVLVPHVVRLVVT